MKLKRVTAVFLAVLMLVFAVPVQAATEDESETAYDYEIGTAQDLLMFAEAVNGGKVSASAVLTADIDVTTLEAVWAPIGTASAPYGGIFSGEGHAVNLNSSLFGVIDGARIEDLTVTGAASGGGIAQSAQGESVISGCVSYADVSASGGTVGGVVNALSGSAAVRNCVNYGVVSGTSTNGVGGVAGQVSGDANITACLNYGDVSSSTLGVGGVVGRHASGGSVSECANYGAVSYDNYVLSLSSYGILGAGGVVGYIYGVGSVVSCCNAGTVTETVNNASGNAGYAYYAGGIVGNGGSLGCTVENCYNTGSISVAASKGFTSNSGSAYAGGIIGHGMNADVSNCFNTGVVTAEADTGEAQAHSIAGTGGRASNCYYLDGCAADELGTKVSADELLELASMLGGAYKDGSKHPLLTWQEDVDENLEPGEEDTWDVMISVAPASASFELTDSTGNVITPKGSPAAGVYIYTLDAEDAYYYSASATGYYSVGTELLPAHSTSVTVTLTEDKRVPAAEGVIYGDGNTGKPNTIQTGGIYEIGDGATGVLTIETTQEVTLIGAGKEAALNDLYINCTVACVNLTLWNVWITDSATANVIDFTGTGNYLYFRGTNLLELIGSVNGYAAIHVPTGTELTLGGVTADDTLYLYKSEQGAGIGGNGSGSMTTPENNGTIILNQGQFFMKATKQGALIGAGANASKAAGTPGDIIIEGGDLNLIAVARGAAIGGSAGSTGASTGTNVYMNGGTLTVNVDYSGAAIGGGGYDAGNDQKDGGTLYYSGGSIRTYIDENAVSAEDLSESLWASWGVTQAGVNGNVAITADITNGTDPLYLCILDTGKLDIGGSCFVVLDGENLIYDGGLHTYCYINKDKLKTDSDWSAISDTTANWVADDDPCLYIYLTGETHTLTVNGAVYTAEWDGESFYVHPANAQMLNAPALSGEAEITKDSVLLAAPVPSAEETAAVLEYRVSADGGNIWSEWQESPVFTDLKANTEYSFQARYRAVDTVRYSDSMPSAAVTIKTAKDPNAFKCEAEAWGQTVTASVSGTNLAGLVDSSGILTANLVTGVGGMTQVAVTISGAALSALAADWEISAFALETDLGLVRFDYTALSTIAADAGESDAVLTIMKYSDTEYSFALTVNGQSIFTGAEGGSIYMELPYSRQDTTKSVLAYDDEGNDLKAEYQPRTEKLAFTVIRLSDITIQEVKQGDPYASVWDGLSLDISWFSPGKSSYSISTPAQLMGLAALVNGIYNDEIVTIVGDVDYIVDHVSDGGSTGSSNESTDTYHYGAYDFNGATVYLTADLDMGGSNGCNYMPIGGQYLMARDDYSTKLSSSFCGVFDGGGHTISNIYCDRYCSGNYGDGSSVGLIGRLGVHDNDPTSLRPSGAAVRNVAVDGYFYANRSVGGIVGKIGKTNGGATIENCANLATVISTDTKGCGGIVGAGWNGGTVRNCYNAGTIQSRYPNPTAGISGSNEITLENCYNVGSISAGSDSFAMAIGTNNGGAPYSSYVINCWYLEGSAPGGGYYSGNTAYNDNALTADYMKTVEFATMMGNDFAMDTAKINNGYPVLAWQEQAAASVIIKSTTTVENDVAETTVTEKDVSASIAAAKKEAADTLYIITDTDGKSANQTVVEIPQASVKAVAEASLTLSVETADGTRVTMSPAVLVSIAGKAGGETVELTVTSQTEEYAGKLLAGLEEYEDTDLTGSITVSVGFSSGGTEINGFSSDLGIEIPVDGEAFQAEETYDVLQVLSDGTVNKLSGKCTTYGGQLYISFSASRLGTFIVLNQTAGVVIASTTTVKDGTAATTVTEKAVSASVAAAKKEAADTLYIITDTDGQSADQTVVEIPRASVKEIADASLNLSVETADGSRVTMSSDTLSSVADQAAGEIVALTVTPGTEEDAKELLGKIEGYENTYLVNSVTADIGISSGGVEISDFTAEFSIEIPVNNEDFQPDAVYSVLQILSDGTAVKLSGKCVADGEQRYVSFSVSNLGTFVVLKNAPIIYDDVNPDDWFYEAVAYVTELGLMNGIGNNLFDPNGTMTRAMLVTVLHRLENIPTAMAANVFSDVPAGTWYTDAVNWANENKIVEGYGNGCFGPDDSVTREQIATILYRYMQYLGLDVSARDSVSRFTDSGEISTWAYEAMQWAVGAGIIEGYETGTVNPGGDATRAEVATMLQRLINLIMQ